MSEIRDLVHCGARDPGRIEVRLAQVMEQRGITRYRLETLTGVRYSVIDRYFKAEPVELVDLDFLAKVCYVMDCELSELLVYHRGEPED